MSRHHRHHNIHHETENDFHRYHSREYLRQRNRCVLGGVLVVVLYAIVTTHPDLFIFSKMFEFVGAGLIFKVIFDWRVDE